MAASSVQEMGYERFSFAIKVGIGSGRVDWGPIHPASVDPQACPNGRAAFYFSGPAVEAAAEAEHLA